MARLCAAADIIVPNATEAYNLLGEPYREGPCTQAEAARVLRGLLALGPRAAVLTGIQPDAAQTGAACMVRGGDIETRSRRACRAATTARAMPLPRRCSARF